MKPKFNHSWNLTVPEAMNLQKSLSQKIIFQDQKLKVNFIAGVDVAYSVNSDKVTSAIVILDVNDNFKLIDSISVTASVTFPYISGLFSFREIPALIKAFDKLSITPDLIVCDGHGYAHPRHLGLASHLGLIYDIPSIGVAKNMMIGSYDILGDKRGSFSNITENDKLIGVALRTQSEVKPVFVSIGHKISLETSIKWVLKLSSKYRLPETTRLADQLSKIT